MNMVTCIKKLKSPSNPFESISHIGGYNSKGDFLVPSEDAIRLIEGGEYKFFVKIGKTLDNIVVGTQMGKKYLKASKDRLIPSNLLSLNECT